MAESVHEATGGGAASRDPASLRTVYLGQFEEEHAEQIGRALEAAGIAWHFKHFGRISRFFFADSWGVRLFVDGTRIEEAKGIVSGIGEAEE